MNTNTFTITKDSNGFNATVEFVNGFSESIEGLYDLDDALNFVKMNISYQDNKYV
jgi:hypothetical protein